MASTACHRWVDLDMHPLSRQDQCEPVACAPHGSPQTRLPHPSPPQVRRPLPSARRGQSLTTEVHLLPTAEGAQDARLTLLEAHRRWFFKLCEDYGLTGIAFGPEQIHVIRDDRVESLKRYFDAKDAEVTLADIPFVRPRDSLPSRFKTLEQATASFTEVVGAMRRALEPPAVIVDYRACRLHLPEGRFVELKGADLAFYAWLARRAMSSALPVRIPSKDQCRWKPEEREELAAYLAEYNAEAARTDIRDGTGTELRAAGAMTYQFFHQPKSSIRECLEEAIGPLAEAYAIKAIEEGRPARYGLAIDLGRTEIVGEGYL